MMKIVALTLCLAMAVSAQHFDDSDFDFGFDGGIVGGFGGGIVGGLGGGLGTWGHPGYSTIHYGGGYAPYSASGYGGFAKGYGGYAKGYGGYAKGYGGYKSYAPVVSYKSYGFGKGKLY